MYRRLTIFALAALLTSCGGSSNTSPGGSTGTPPPSGSNPPSAATPVTVSAGGTATGMDITVPSPSATTPPNAEDLGVAALTGTGSAFNTGDTIHRGSTQRVLLFGQGLTGTITVSIGGPSDISISNVLNITSTDNTPGVSFTATVSGTAALGARTVALQNSSGDVTTFTGGLEVVQ